MTTIDTVSAAYIRAGLRIGEEIADLVDAYYGPPELREQARELSVEDALARLDREIERLPASRRQDYLSNQADALKTVSGERPADYLDEVELTFGIRPEWTPEETFEAAHRQLDELLPGSGSLTERRQAYQRQFHIDPNRALEIANSLMAELRERTARILNLPDGESAEINLVNDKPWRGYNWYLGNLRSRIDINTDLPIRANSLPDLVAHEIYCGHHTEHTTKEQRWYRENGWGEAAITLLTSPQAVISEGIATVAFERLVPENERADWVREHCFKPAGIELDAAADLALQRAARDLGWVNANAALLLHDQGADEDDVVDYIQRWSLRNEAEARQTVRFITTPILRCYIFTYTSGHELVDGYLSSSTDRTAALRSLMEDHWHPVWIVDGTPPQP